MFSNKKETNQKGSSRPSNGNHSLNSLVKGTTVDGNISSESDIRVDGTLKGTLECKAKVIIGPAGFVSGKVNCQNAVIEGRFEGTLHVVEVLNIREKATVEGDIHTNKLVVHAGADIRNFRCNMNSNAAQNTESKDGAMRAKMVTANAPSNKASIKEAS